MPDMFIYDSVYHQNKVIDTNSIWIVRTPRELNPVFYHKLDIIINTLFADLIWNSSMLWISIVSAQLIPEIYDSRIEPVLNHPNLSQERKDLFRLCATFAVDDSGLFMEKNVLLHHLVNLVMKNFSGSTLDMAHFTNKKENREGSLEKVDNLCQIFNKLGYQLRSTYQNSNQKTEVKGLKTIKDISVGNLS